MSSHSARRLNHDDEDLMILKKQEAIKKAVMRNKVYLE